MEELINFNLEYYKVMTNSSKWFSVLDDKKACTAHFQQNYIVRLNEKQQTRDKIILQQPIKFQITKTEILQNKVYKFYLNLRIKSQHAQSLTLIIDGKQCLEYVFKYLSFYGVAAGLEQMIISYQKIGQGSFAEVYKITTNYDSILALKMFDKKNLSSPKNQMAYKNQIQLMQKLQSPYLATANGIFQTDKAFYIKMEYFTMTLKSYIKQKISLKKQKTIMKQLFLAAIQMKFKGILHRDLKPQNIMLRFFPRKNQQAEEQFQCVIIDFGLATQANAQYIFYRCGTPGFLAPQVAKMTKKQKLTPACDMFSLACIFFKMITKKYIFADKDYKKVIQKNKKVQLPENQFEKLSQNQNDIIRKMLIKDPTKRITPQEALKHPYFSKDIDEQDIILQQNCDVRKKIQTFNGKTLRKQTMESIMSEFSSICSMRSTFANGSNLSNFDKIQAMKDSCLSFQGPVRQKAQNPILKQIDRNQKRKSRFSQINGDLKINIF